MTRPAKPTAFERQFSDVSGSMDGDDVLFLSRLQYDRNGAMRKFAEYDPTATDPALLVAGFMRFGFHEWSELPGEPGWYECGSKERGARPVWFYGETHAGR